MFMCCTCFLIEATNIYTPIIWETWAEQNHSVPSPRSAGPCTILLNFCACILPTSLTGYLYELFIIQVYLY